MSKEVQKPGASIHTKEWDKCVQDVKRKGGANAYAVCTAQLGEESFKRQYKYLAKTLVPLAKHAVFGGSVSKEVNAAFAGDIPNSLLADQDLETDEKKKGFIQESGNALNDIANTAPDISSNSAKKHLVSRIKTIQQARQKATIKEREQEDSHPEEKENTEKSFLENWRELNEREDC